MNTKLQILFAVLGVILTAFSTLASWKQYNVAALQAKVAESALMPQIQVTTELVPDDSGYFSDQRLIVSNSGGPAYNVQVNTITWIALENGGAGDESIHSFQGYFGASFPTGNLSGVLNTFAGYRNNKKADNLERLVMEVCMQKCFPRKITLVYVSYQDALSSLNKKYILLNEIAPKYLSLDEGQRLWLKASSSATDNSPELESLQERKAVEAWLKLQPATTVNNG